MLKYIIFKHFSQSPLLLFKRIAKIKMAKQHKITLKNVISTCSLYTFIYLRNTCLIPTSIFSSVFASIVLKTTRKHLH